MSGENRYFGKIQQYIISTLAVLVVSAICYFVSDYIGYRTVSLILLFTVSVVATVFSVYPALLAAVLSALIWDFFFIPPFITFHVEKTEDVLMLLMYIVIALLNGFLTSRIRHFEKQAHQREERLSALKLYNTLFNSISHELRTPITTIMGATENITANQSKLSDNDRKILHNEIIIASERLNRLVDNLLNMSRLESGFLQPKLDWCDVSELIHSVADRLKPAMENHPLSIEISENIPLVKIDAGLIEQALFNIIHNISVHTPSGTSAEIKAEFRENNLVIAISDDGPGFPDEKKAMVFDRFYRAGGGKTGGLGLGLSIAKGFIEAHKGEIKLDSLKPNGAIFSIYVPCETTIIELDHE